jgi:hypothetical protein
VVEGEPAVVEGESVVQAVVVVLAGCSPTQLRGGGGATPSTRPRGDALHAQPKEPATPMGIFTFVLSKPKRSTHRLQDSTLGCLAMDVQHDVQGVPPVL